MTTFVIAAGKATRLDGAFKPHVVVGGRRVIDRQLDVIADPDVVVVKRSEHPDTDGTTSVVLDDGRGPVDGLLAGLEHHMVTPTHVSVLYSDTLIGKIPPGGDLVATQFMRGTGREWDWWGGARYHRSNLNASDWANVCVGLYKFMHADALRQACITALRRSKGDVHMIDVLNIYAYYFPLKNVKASGWLDVGDPQAIAVAEQELRRVA